MEKVKGFFGLCALIAFFLLSGTSDAAGRPESAWIYQANGYMQNCMYHVFDAAEQHGNMLLATTGTNVTIRLICPRKQGHDENGQLLLGSEGSYSGPDGSGGVSVGSDRPCNGLYFGTGTCSDGTSPRSLPKAREWTVHVTDQPQTLSFNWTGELGSDQLTLKLQPIVAPVYKQQLDEAWQPVQQRADQAWNHADDAWNRASHSWEDRMFTLQFQYTLGLDTLDRSGDTRKGYGVDAAGLLGDGEAKLLLGVTFAYDMRQKPVAVAPNAAPGGFNEYVDWSTYFVGPKIGLDWMPNKVFNLQLWGSVGALVSVDGTVPVSQLPNGSLYTGQSSTDTVAGYRLVVQPGFVLGERVLLGANFGLMGNLFDLPEARGPEQVCDDQTGDCLERREGLFTDVQLGLVAGLVL